MTAPGIVRSEPDISGSLQPFRERLAETVAWCQRRASMGNLPESLRSPTLAPPPVTPWHEIVRAVSDARLQLLGRSWRRSIDPLGGGHLLLYFPPQRETRGNTRSMSGGYFDSRDAPPWDTWVAHIEEATRSYLVAWVPPEAFLAVTRTLKLPQRSLRWLNGAGVELEEQLRSQAIE